MFTTYEMTVIKKSNGNKVIKGQVTVLDIEYVKVAFIGYGYDVLRCYQVPLDLETARKKAKLLFA